MSVVVIVPPKPIVSLALAKQHLRVDGDDEDELITSYIATAQAAIDGPGGWLNRAIMPQTLELRQDGFYSQDWALGGGLFAWSGGWRQEAWSSWPFHRVQLPFPPLISVVSITYEGVSGADQTLTSSGWLATDEGVEPSFGASWPGGRLQANAVRIRYRAGYEIAGNPAPPPQYVQGVLMAVAGLYMNREDIVIDAARVTQVVNDAATNLVTADRIFNL